MLKLKGSLRPRGIKRHVMTQKSLEEICFHYYGNFPVFSIIFTSSEKIDFFLLTSSYSRVSSFQLILFIMSRLNLRCDLGPPSTTTIEQSRFKIVAPVMYSCFEFISILNFFFASFNDLLGGSEMINSVKNHPKLSKPFLIL